MSALRWSPGRWLRVCTVVIAGARLAMIVTAPYPRLVGAFEDDAFYYFGIARHLAWGDGSTFNGIDLTNGYHPLWLLLLTPPYLLADGRTALVLIGVLSAAIFVAAMFLLARLVDRAPWPAAVGVASVPLMALGASGPSYWFNGMESGIVLLAEIAVVIVLAKTNMFERLDPQDRRVWACGALLAGLVLSRLDRVLLACLVILAAAWTWRGRGRKALRGIVALSLPGLGTGLAYLAANQALFGSALPVSGRAKSLGGPFLNLSVFEELLAAPTVLSVDTYAGLAAMALALGALLTTRSLAGSAEQSNPATPFARIGALLAVATLVIASYYAITSSWQLWPWYFATIPLIIAVSAAALLTPLTPKPGLLTALAFGVGLVFVVGNVVRQATTDPLRSAFIRENAVVAEKLERLLPAGTTVAMGDRAGSLGYLLDRPLIHLEGLVGPAAYLDALREGQARVDAFLAERKVGVYVRSGYVQEDPIAVNGCRAFDEPHQGGGPKVDIVVCDRDLLDYRRLADGTVTRSWRFDPPG